ncbi:MAG: ribulose-phosphate 3-epimerase [Sumerlaeia bacterium]
MNDPAKGNGSVSRRGTGVRIAPSLLAADFSCLEDAVKPLKGLSVRWLHLDVMDGHFVPNISFGPAVIGNIRPLDPNLFFDVHLMISEPRRYFERFVEAGANHITFHVEAAGRDESPRLLRDIKAAGVQAGISIKPDTPVSAIRDCLPDADMVLVMTVEPGFGGQRLIPHTLNKVRELVLLREEIGLNYLLQVDGGIDPSTAHLAVAAGADILVAGSSVYGKGGVRENIRQLRKSMMQVQ